jgi:TatD DNase family protein
METTSILITYEVSIYDMIDSHCHLEQEDYDSDRATVIRECKERLKAVVTCCADPRDWEITEALVNEYPKFVYAIAGIHPEFIKDFEKDELKEFIEVIKKESKNGKIKAIGEIGLDYYWIKDAIWRDRQKDLFIRMIELSKELNLPVVVHSRDAVMECISVLEEQGMKGKKVLMHLMGDKDFVDRIVENKWMISIGPGIIKSKETRKIARDCSLKNLLLETDSPWFGLGNRGTPLNVVRAAEKIAEIKKISVEEVEKQTDENAIEFFGLKS